MIHGIHGDHPISFQLDRAIAKAEEIGRPIVKIRAAKPFIDNLLAELSDTMIYAAEPRVARYCGVEIETEPAAETGWLAYDASGLPIYDCK